MIVKYWCNVPVSVPWHSTGQWRDVQIWLLDNVPNADAYDFVGRDPDNHNNRVYFFQNEKDAMMFSLRWA